MLFSHARSGRFLTRVVLPTLLGVGALTVFVGGLLVWAGREADDVALERQAALVTLVIANLRETIAHNQESVTVWDDAVRAVEKEDAAEWIDYNLGSWMHTYFGHDGAYVLNPIDEPIYQFSTSPGNEPYRAVEAVAEPLVQSVRQQRRDGDETSMSDRMLSQGAADIGVIDGHPAVVSAKPIVSDTGEIEQTPGTEHVHVAVRYLDGDFLNRLEQDYLFSNMRFDWVENTTGTLKSLPLTAASGETIGYFVWEPYRPGAAVVRKVAPAAAAIMTLLLLVILALLFLLDLRSRKLADRDARMKHLALHDSLTELPNRVHFHDQLERALRLRRDGHLLGVLYLDLDHFKQVNDTLGHPAGDAVLREFAARLKGLIRPSDTLSRLGGDEFTLIIPNVATVENLQTLSDRIIDAVRRPFFVSDHQVFVGVTIGIAVAPIDGEQRIELCRKADIALYHAKNAGRGRYAIFGSEMDAMLQVRRDIERDLRLALQRTDQLEVYFQPLFRASTQTIIGVEALLRWRHPTNGWISPDVFIPIAEETGMIEAIGEFVLRSSCEAARAWPELCIAINVSAIELRNPVFAVKVAARLLEFGFDPHRLELELTESALTDASGVCDQNLRALRELGVRVALDDFGTGFSSLGRLQKLEVDRIKIDRSFINGFGRSNGDEAIVEAIVELARARGLKTTAEGVETAEQGDHLQAIGCDDLQGFLYSRPVPAKDISALMHRAHDLRQTA
ncbi:putative bifunctional diguanylate cyclase/phosphodiesterase [Tianweitania sediminis]|uniref:EAL domain-containing protein n=1 Tax=Tianweitania sediminis TaxID=1502156 RepID=A0A8J7R5A2_9HYPH|nr:EAL domain-containing protein [Tianweitania sediminis]MBP0441181.1 EAL domain-containing protein [Tianweitania sediminis]